MKQPYRKPHGGRIDRARPLPFTFNGTICEGYAGDTLASALLANGVHRVSRSYKFHRSRGIFSAGVEEPNALLGVDRGSGTVPLVRATLMPLCEGLRAETQNCFPSVKFDLGRAFDFTRAIWPAGFYNKMFKWPSWHAYEWAVRAVAGLGRLPDGVDTTRYRHMNGHCDVLIIGAGASGLAAALESARNGDDVLVVEQDSEAGGALLFDSAPVDSCAPHLWLAAALAELRSLGNVRIMLHATVAGYYDHNVLTIHDRSAAYRSEHAVETFWKVRAGRVILASGAIEQPLLFANNDLPGIMLAGAMHQYANRFGVHCGNRIVGVVNNDVAWRSLLALHDSGSEEPAIIDMRDNIRAELLDAAATRSIQVYPGSTLLGARGTSRVTALRFLDAGGKSRTIRCDAIAVSGGLSPTVHLYAQAGGQLRYDAALACFVPFQCRQRVVVVGAANGDFAAPQSYSIAPRRASPEKTTRQWVDLQHDVTVSDIELAVRENYVSVEHLKRYTTVGMSIDQGKTSNLNALTLLGQLTERTPGAVGTTTFRPQFMPVTMGAIAGNRRGEFYKPSRRLAAHEWHAAHGAVFDEYGGWQRPAYYGLERSESIGREVRTVREAVGLFDGSPLGKIEVKGPDAAEFLNRIYVNTVRTLKPGKIRYGMMLNENGVIIDDGVFIRISPDHFLVNTTSGQAERIASWFEEWHQCEWSDLDVVFSPVTSQWCVSTLAGPKARDVLTLLPGLIDLSNEKFPHMSFAGGRLDDGTAYRLQRVSFSGELSYELSVPADRATEILTRLQQLGGRHGIGLFGIEALMVLRIEKGFLHVGVDTDGTTNPLDIGFRRIVDGKKDDFIGARSLRRPADRRMDRRQLIGFEVDDQTLEVRAGAHFVTERANVRRSEGFVTSVCSSPTLGRTVGLGLLEGGFDRIGESVQIQDDDGFSAVRIAPAGFYDNAGARMRG